MLFNRITNRLFVHYVGGIRLKVTPTFLSLSCHSNGICIHRCYVIVNIKRSKIFDCTSNLNRNVATTVNADDKIIAVQEVTRYMIQCMTKTGTSESHAKQLADVLVAADIRGHYSHGLNRLGMYVRDIQEGICMKDGVPKILKENTASAWIDGNNLLGPVVGNFCMDIAIKKAKEAGVGWVVAKGSNHFGIAGWYSIRAMNEGLLGMAFTNTSPIMYPTRSSVAALGTNPLTLAAKAKNDTFILDMATTTAAIGKHVKSKLFRIHGVWQKNGCISNDPAKILDGGGLLPLGGTELTGGYKGYCLGALVEIICGVLGGAQWGPHVRQWMSTTAVANLGQCFIAINPNEFAPNFENRLQEFIDAMRGLKSVDNKQVLVAGDPEKEHIALVEKYGGIPYHKSQINHAEELAKTLGVSAMITKSTV
ncbi:malate/L-lactate dehydrogenase [Wuchereria bancrofti]|uniref:Malate/L-lactate dehydrogenase n=1 Tax=Wuchereria bancrofti TaxID=6293 RepID=J9B7H8_WUCBA|nr:malate/L-lactate dehydrogenase [Wuchereria bancrofti]